MALIVIRRTAGSNTATYNGRTFDLSRYFTVTRDKQGLRADRAGEFQRSFVNPTKEALGLPIS